MKQSVLSPRNIRLSRQRQDLDTDSNATTQQQSIMKLAVFTAALVAAIPAMAAPAGSIQARAEFAAPVTLAFTSQAQGAFTDATRRGTKLDPVASIDASNPGEKQRYTFTDSSDVAKIAWVVGGEKLDVSVFNYKSCR